MIALAVSASSILSLVVLNPWQNFHEADQSFANLVGTVEYPCVVFTHTGGEKIRTDAELQLDLKWVNHEGEIEEASASFPNIKDALLANKLDGDFDYVDPDYWSIGEYFSWAFSSPVPTGVDYNNTYVKAMIIDKQKNLIIYEKVIREIPLEPYVLSLPVEEETVSETTATICMYYNFITSEYFNSDDAALEFCYKKASDSDYKILSVPPLGIRMGHCTELTGLSPNTKYEFYANLTYSKGEFPVTAQSEKVTFFTYDVVRGIYTFESGSDADSRVADSQQPYVHGIKTSGVKYSSFVPGDVGSTRSVLFDDVDDIITIPYHNKYTFTDSLQIETWMNSMISDEEIFGHIAEQYNKSHDLSDVEDLQPDIIELSSDYYAIACSGERNAYLFTVHIDDDHHLIEYINQIQFTTSAYAEPCIIHITGNIYAIAFGGTTDQSEDWTSLLTLTISPEGIIAQDIINKVDINEYYGSEPCMIHVHGNVYAISFGGEIEQGMHTGAILTLQITDLGIIDTPSIHETYLPSSQCYETDLVHLKDTYYVLAYGASSGMLEEQVIWLLSIDEYGSISFLHSYSLPTPHCFEPTIKVIDADKGIVAISYGVGSAQNPGEGFLQTYRINEKDIYSIKKEDYPVRCSETAITRLQNNIYVIAYTDVSTNIGSLATYIIDDQTGVITPLDIHTFTQPDMNCNEPSLLTYRDSQIMVCYGGMAESLYDGFIAVAEVNLESPRKDIVVKTGSYGLYTNGDSVFGFVVCADGAEAEISHAFNDGWNYIKFSFNGNCLSLQINNNPPRVKIVYDTIKNTTNPIHLGPFHGYVDELKIGRIPPPPTT